MDDIINGHDIALGTFRGAREGIVAASLSVDDITNGHDVAR